MGGEASTHTPKGWRVKNATVVGLVKVDPVATRTDWLGLPARVVGLTAAS